MDSQLSAMGTATQLGNRQGAGTIELSDLLTNYRDIVVKVGYYNSGHPCYGYLHVPVSCLAITSTSGYYYCISCSETNYLGSARIQFTSATTVTVHEIYDSTRYIVVFGIA